MRDRPTQRLALPGMERPVVARDLTKRFGDFVAVDAIDFVIEPGETFGMLGPNGAGKSSTMKMVSSVSPVTSGELRVLGMDPATDGQAIRARLGVVPQEDILDTELSVRENLRIYLRYFGVPWFEDLGQGRRGARLRAAPRPRVEPGRGPVGRHEAPPHHRPGPGERSRSGAARRADHRLDPQARHLLWERLYRLKEQGVTLLLTTHYMDEAEQLSDRLVIMDQGRIVAEGSPANLIKQHVTREVAELRFDGESSGAGDLESIAADGGLRVDRLPDRHLVYADDGDGAISWLRDHGVHPSGTYVRRASLEDVFLTLTGRSLIE